ncbi:MAG: UDP-4-amino-4,6-dideoxy-N-acetyl-beta-L-altrosamine transaminase [Candidatus Omnitrophica bacterium]|nr:UDP-4-amino-4,6-dideoxy-N-acetyl-beta-L-altrosamine transaminase [Candidatus Omnitrophota bacterium]
MKKIPYARQSISDKDIKALLKATGSDWLTQGPEVRKFEEDLAGYVGAKHAVAVSSGTAALHLAMLALGVGQGDKVLTSPVTFAASANCALYVGAEPAFIDIDGTTYHMDPEKLDSFLEKPSNRKRVKAVILVHLMGTVADIVGIKRICDRYGIPLVEDAAHALGARYSSRGKWFKTGSCAHSKAVIASFHPIKHITTGEGGAVFTNDKNVYERILRFRHHGMVKGGSDLAPHLKKYSRQQWFYDIPEVGFNYRITDFQCALGSSQLKRLDEFVEKRRKIAARYNEAFSDMDQIQLPCQRGNSYASYHLYVIRVPAEKRDALYAYLRGKNILTQVNYIPVHLFSHYGKNFGYAPGDYPEAERYFEECLSLPMYPSLGEKDQNRVIKNIRGFFRT